MIRLSDTCLELGADDVVGCSDGDAERVGKPLGASDAVVDGFDEGATDGCSMHCN